MKYKALWITLFVIAIIVIAILGWKVWKDKQDAAALVAGQVVTKNGTRYVLNSNGAVVPIGPANFPVGCDSNGVAYSQNGGTWSSLDRNCSASELKNGSKI